MLATKNLKRPRNSILNNLEHLITIALLKKLYQQLNKSKTLKFAAEIKRKYEENLEENLLQLIRRIRNGTYRPQPMPSYQQITEINNLEWLTTPHLEDKLVQNATHFILSKLYNIS